MPKPDICWNKTSVWNINKLKAMYSNFSYVWKLEIWWEKWSRNLWIVNNTTTISFYLFRILVYYLCHLDFSFYPETYKTSEIHIFSEEVLKMGSLYLKYQFSYCLLCLSVSAAALKCFKILFCLLEQHILFQSLLIYFLSKKNSFE